MNANVLIGIVFAVMGGLALLAAVPVSLRYSAPFNPFTIPFNIPNPPIKINENSKMAHENGDALSSTILAKVFAALFAVGLLWLFLMMLYSITSVRTPLPLG